jgi:hypothetical protein
MKNKGLLAFRLFATALAFLGMGYRLIIDPIMDKNWLQALDMLGYFTIQSGLIVLFVFASLLINQVRGTPEKAVAPQVRGAALLYITITSVIFMVLLNSKIESSGLSKAVLYINHLATAILLLIDNVLTIKPGTYKWSLIPLWLIYPIVYLVFSIIEGVGFGRFRYFFLNFNELSLSTYLLFIIMLIIIFSIVSAMIIFFNKVYKAREKL